MSSPPPLRLPDAVRRDLEGRRPGLASEMERVLLAHARPCVALRATRVSGAPLHRHALTRWLGARVAEPVLGPLEPKLGGLPYAERDEPWDGYAFLGQIDLDAATAVLPAGAPRLRGLLRIDRASSDSYEHDFLRVRWFPEPSPERVAPVAPRSVGAWEARLHATLAWTLPQGDALEALWPPGLPRWFDYDRFAPAGYDEDDDDSFHRLLGHKTAGLDEPYGFTPPPGCGDDLAAYELLLRLTYDNAAGFGWGTNWVYLLVPREDLARGDLSRIVVTGANA